MAIGYAVKHKRYWNDIGLGNWREFTKKRYLCGKICTLWL